MKNQWPKIGDLNVGFAIKAISLHGDHDPNGATVYAEEVGSTKAVSWVFDIRNGGYFWGRYGSRESARDAFEERLQKQRERGARILAFVEGKNAPAVRVELDDEDDDGVENWDDFARVEQAHYDDTNR